MNSQSQKMNSIAVFGVFDHLHPGHESFLKQAAELGQVTAIVARDSIVHDLKGRPPHENENERLQNVKNSVHVHDAVLGDTYIGHYQALQQINPDMIALGYDQEDLRNDMVKWMEKNDKQFEITVLKPHKEDEFKSSIMYSYD